MLHTATFETKQPFHLKKYENALRHLKRVYVHQTKEIVNKKPHLKSQNTIWDTVKLLERFQKPEYCSRNAKISLLKADINHYAREVALVEPITKFSYWHTVESNETKGDGYYEDLSLMMNSFAQDISNKGLNASRASIEAMSFNKAKQMLLKSAITQSNVGVLITSFPDEKQFGYDGVDSKYDWNKPETHHSFFYLLKVGDVKHNENGIVTQFEIKTTQYRAWPNAKQAFEIHKLLGKQIKTLESDEPIPNLLFANVIEVELGALQQIIQELHMSGLKSLEPHDPDESLLENHIKQIIYRESENHLINHTHLPNIDHQEFWQIQNEYFDSFYLEAALPVFEEIIQLQTTNAYLDKKTAKIIQNKIDYLDKAFFYYSKILLGWIKLHNTNPEYTEAFREKNQIEKLIAFQQKLLLKILGQKSNQNLPSPKELLTVLDIDHRLATKQTITFAEKKKLLSVWGFFSFAGRIGSLLHCGTLTPFSLPISIMNKSLGNPGALTQFTDSLSSIPMPKKQQFLEMLQNEEYVELDLTRQEPPANKIYSVPKSYLLKTTTGEPGCIVDKDGTVLGPCIETIIINGKVIKKRIALDDPRDTLAFPMTIHEFNQYIQSLQQNIKKTTLSEIDTVFQTDHFSVVEKRKAQVVIKKLRQKLFKQSLGLQEFISGNIINQEFDANNEWLRELVIKLSFSLNPVETLIFEVEQKIKSDDQMFEDTIKQID